MKTIVLKHVTHSFTEVRASNGKKLGELLRSEDGYFNFWPEIGPGYWPEHIMREIADELKSMNTDWNRIVAQCEEDHKNAAIQSIAFHNPYPDHGRWGEDDGEAKGTKFENQEIY